MTHLPSSFRAGKIVIDAVNTKAWPEQPLLGSGWRGLLTVAGVVFLLLGLWALGSLVLSAAFVWSTICGALRYWKRIYLGQKTMYYLRMGRGEEAMEMCSNPEPGSKIWWHFLARYFRQHRWQLAEDRLKELDAGSERDYLMSLIKLGLNRPAEALSLCPPRPDGAWLVLKAEALFQMQEWQKVLGLLRVRSAWGKGQQLEYAWLKGGCYYFLKQYKPAIKILRQVAEHGREDYSIAEDWLNQALARIE